MSPHCFSPTSFSLSPPAPRKERQRAFTLMRTSGYVIGMRSHTAILSLPLLGPAVAPQCSVLSPMANQLARPDSCLPPRGLSPRPSPPLECPVPAARTQPLDLASSGAGPCLGQLWLLPPIPLTLSTLPASYKGLRVPKDKGPGLPRFCMRDSAPAHSGYETDRQAFSEALPQPSQRVQTGLP